MSEHVEVVTDPTTGNIETVLVPDRPEESHTNDPQIIRTVEELEALHPYTLLTYIGYSGSYTTAVCLHPDDLPAVVVAPAAQVRAAFKALEEA